MKKMISFLFSQKNRIVKFKEDGTEKERFDQGLKAVEVWFRWKAIYGSLSGEIEIEQMKILPDRN